MLCQVSVIAWIGHTDLLIYLQTLFGFFLFVCLTLIHVIKL